MNEETLSTEQRAKHIVTKLVDLLRLDNLVEENIEFLNTFLSAELKKYEKVVKDKSIAEIEMCCKKHVITVGVEIGYPQQFETVNLNKVCAIIHNLEVG